MTTESDLRKAQECCVNDGWVHNESPYDRDRRHFLAGRTSLREELLKVGVEGAETCVKYISGKRPNTGEEYNAIFNPYRANDSIWSDVKDLQTKKFIELLPIAAKIQQLEFESDREKKQSIDHAKFCDRLDAERLEMIARLEAENAKLKADMELLKMCGAEFTGKTLKETENK